MVFLVSAEFAGAATELQNIEPWLKMDRPVWENGPPLGIYLNDKDKARYAASAFSKVIAVLDVPVSDGQSLTDFCAAAMAARIDQLVGSAADERAVAAALRQDYMQLQENFLAVEAFLNGALAPKFTLARQWDFANETQQLEKGEILTQALPVSSAALVAVDLWLVSGAAQVSLLRANGSHYVEAATISGSGWQRVQFAAIGSTPDGVSLKIEALEGCEIGLSHPSALPKFGDRPLAIRLWKGLAGVRLPEVAIVAKPRSFVMPADLPPAESLGSGTAKYLETTNTLMIHTDYYGKAKLVFRGIDLALPATAHIQNCGPETLQVLICLVGRGEKAPARFQTSVFLAPEAYMQCEIVSDAPENTDLIVEIKGQTSLDCLSLRGIEIG